jgi:phosphoribosylformylglycinamidine (FGAM) synthase PurS component
VMPKAEVLDSQGRAVEKTLSHHGKKVEACRVGRYIELEFAEGDKNKAMAKAQEIAEFVLYNPLTEVYEIEFL